MSVVTCPLTPRSALHCKIQTDGCPIFHPSGGSDENLQAVRNHPIPPIEESGLSDRSVPAQCAETDLLSPGSAEINGAIPAEQADG